MKFSPCNAWVMLRMDDESKTTRRNGLILPEGVTDSQFLKGRVVEVGPGLWSVDQIKRIPMGVKIGDVAIFAGGGLEFRIDGLKYILIQETSIVGVLTGEDGDGVSEGGPVGRPEATQGTC